MCGRRRAEHPWQADSCGLPRGTLMSDVWRSIDVIVSPDPMHPQRYSVEFRSRTIILTRGPSGEKLAISPHKIVTVQDEDGFKAIAFSHLESAIPDLSQTDYAQKAIKAVSEYRAHHLKELSAE